MYKFLIRTLSFVRATIISVVAVQKDARGRHPLPCVVVDSGWTDRSCNLWCRGSLEVMDGWPNDSLMSDIADPFACFERRGLGLASGKTGQGLENFKLPCRDLRR